MENEERQLLIVLLHIRLYDLSEILSALDQNDFWAFFRSVCKTLETIWNQI